MGLRYIIDKEATSDAVAMYDSVTGWAFGPVFDTAERADQFQAFLKERGYADARALDDRLLEGFHAQFVREVPKDAD